MNTKKQPSVEGKIIALLNELRPQVNQDGGDFDFIGYSNGVVKLQLQGACIGCPLADQTFKLGIEQQLKEHIPQVKSVEMVGM